MVMLQVNSARLKSSVASKNRQVKTFGGTICFAVDGAYRLLLHLHRIFVLRGLEPSTPIIMHPRPPGRHIGIDG